MSKFKCSCGYLISFNLYPSRYDAEVARQSGYEEIDDAFSRSVAEFIAFIVDNRREEWLQRFYSEVFPISNAAVVSDIVARHMSDFTLALHQCERCGRLWLQQRPGENAYVSYRPEGAWRGALETHAPGFIGYVEGQDFFQAYIADVSQENGLLRVTLTRGDTETLGVTFLGVSNIQRHDSETKQVRFLSEWESEPPFRRFVFDSTSQSFEPLLEVTALEVRLSGQGQDGQSL
jgi:hypothetical protein